MDAQVVWGWETAQVCYLYAELYLMPLILMLILSTVAMFRQDYGYKPVNALDDGDRSPRPSGGSDQSTFELTSLFAPLFWLQFDLGYDSDDGEDFDGEQMGPESQGHRNRALNGPSPTKTQWSEAAQQALDGIISRFPQQALERLSEASLRIIPRKCAPPTPLHPDKFPSDVQVNIMSFLLPKDVVTFACTSRVCRDIVDGSGPTTAAIWKSLWQRDYGWIMKSWEIGRQAFLRSNIGQHEAHDKDFYFRFGLSYANYLLAGLNSPSQCFVGLHGNLYDITDFVIKHPGSPETLFVHAGRDATKLFDDMDHSKGARRLTKEFCIAVDMSYLGSCGLKPTVLFDNDTPVPATVEAKPVIGKKERRKRPPECLRKVYNDYSAELQRHQKELNREMKDNQQVLHWAPYYDPFQRAWRSWYTSREFETVFK